MTSTLEAVRSVRQWSTPAKKTVEGVPPGPNDHPQTFQSESRKADLRTVTPIYKVGSTKAANGNVVGSPSSSLSGIANRGGDYKVQQTQEHYRLQVLDPKVQSNANMPVSSQTLPSTHRRKPANTGDFPSMHSKHSLLKLTPMEQRRLRSVESRPITTSKYLTESVDRHREMEASRLRDYLKAKEGDANKPWNKPNWPGPKEDESSRELDQIRQTIENLQKAASDGARKNDDELEQLTGLREQLLQRAKGRRSDYRLQESEILKEGPVAVPGYVKDQIRELLESRVSNDTSSNSMIMPQDRSGYVTDMSSATWQFSSQSFSPRSVVSINGGTKDDNGLLKVRTDLSPSLSRTLSRSNAAVQTAHIDQDDRNKPRSIMKRRELETKQQMLYPEHQQQQRQWQDQQQVLKAQPYHQQPSVTETVQKFEESKRTEEIERRVQQRVKKDKHHRHGSSHRQHRSSSGHNNGYSDSYHRSTFGRREHDFGGGDWRDSLRRGELKYVPNGDLRETSHHHNMTGSSMRSNGRVHKSHSTRDVFANDYDDRSYSSSYRGGGPLIEFPPTLPRHAGDMTAPMPPPHRGGNNGFYKPLPKSRSYADWDDGGRGGFGGALKRYDNDMTRLEHEFRDSLLMPMPNGKVDEKDFREEKIPGGYESFSRDVKADSGRRLNRDGQPTQYSEATQEFNYKRETESDRRR